MTVIINSKLYRKWVACLPTVPLTPAAKNKPTNKSLSTLKLSKLLELWLRLSLMTPRTPGKTPELRRSSNLLMLMVQVPSSKLNWANSLNGSGALSTLMRRSPLPLKMLRLPRLRLLVIRMEMVLSIKTNSLLTTIPSARR